MHVISRILSVNNQTINSSSIESKYFFIVIQTSASLFTFYGENFKMFLPKDT